MSQSISRRSFLKCAGSGAVSLAAALLTGVCAAAQQPCLAGEPALLDGKAAVEAEGYLADQNDKLQVTSPDALSYQVKKGETVTYNVMAKGLNALTDGPVTLTFYPDLQYSEFNANWELTADVLAPEESGPSTT